MSNTKYNRNRINIFTIFKISNHDLQKNQKSIKILILLLPIYLIMIIEYKIQSLHV